LGGEYGDSTGRARQVIWLDIDKLQKAFDVNGVTHLIFNKLDILEQVGIFKLYQKDKMFSYNISDQFIKHIYDGIDAPLYKITFSRTPETI
jgi:adenylosuccinate synthase